VNRRVYVVRRKNPDDVGVIPDPQWQYWAAFDTREAAEQHARDLDLGEWLVNGPPWGANPFENGLEAVTTMPEGAFRDWLMDAGIEPPAPVTGKMPPVRLQAETRFSWINWWRDEVGPPAWTLSRDQKARLREGLDRVPLWSYEVVDVDSAEAPAADPAVVYAVVLKSWEYDDSWYHGDNEALAVYRTRARAQAECDRLNAGVPEHYDTVECEHVVVELQVDPDRDGG
jgi:hypothetical protein